MDRGSASLITITGSAKDSGCGPTIGLFEIGESKKGYIFRVAMPGVLRDFTCHITRNGRVMVKGKVHATASSKDVPRGCRMIVQQLPPPGPFSLTFNLPGPVDTRLSSLDYKNGLLEAMVAKFQTPIVATPVGIYPTA